MRKNPLLLLSICLLLSLFLPSQTMLAAPQTQGPIQDLQIVLVLDVSGSMSTPVYTGIVPEDLLSLLLRMDEITRDPDYKDLQDQIKEAENAQAVQDAKDNRVQTFENITIWIEDDQGVSFQEVLGRVSAALKEAGCETTSDQQIATASNSDMILSFLWRDCPPETNEWTLLEELLELIPYLDDPEYIYLRGEWVAANEEVEQALDNAGYATLAAELEASTVSLPAWIWRKVLQSI